MKVCFHFSYGTDAFGEALQRFSNLLLDKVMARTCQNHVAIQRDIFQVNSELDKANLFSWKLYLTKRLVNLRHPYSKVTLGSLESLKTVPEIVGMNVPKELYKFYQERYRADQAILAVVSPASLADLEKMVQPFAATLLRRTDTLLPPSEQPPPTPSSVCRCCCVFLSFRTGL